MSHPNKISDEKIREILELRNQGLSFAGIGRELSINRETCRKYYKRFSSSTDQPLPEFTDKPGPPPDKLNILEIDERPEDQIVTSIVRRDQGMKPSEFKVKAGLNDEWITTHFRQKEWQGYYKLKNYLPAKTIRKLVETVRDGGGEQEVKDAIDCAQVGHEVVDLQGSSVCWKRIIGEQMYEAIKDWMQTNVKPIQVPATPEGTYLKDTPFAVSWGIYDLHVGMYSFAKEVGRDWDVNIAVNRVLNSIDDMIEELRPYNIQRIFMPIGNDFMHFDNVRQRTTSAMHDLDSDSRWQRALRAAIEILTYLVQRALEICENLDIFWVPGNHDTYTSYQLTTYLWGRFHGDARVKVDLNENPQKVRRYGGVGIVYEHGDGVKKERWPLIFEQTLAEHARQNSISTEITYREVQVGHTHQKSAKDFMAETPIGGIRLVVNPTLCNTDFWHHKKGFVGSPSKSMEAFRYDETGVRGSHTAWARDDERNI